MRVEAIYETNNGKDLHVDIEIPVGGVIYAHQVRALLMNRLPKDVRVVDEHPRLSATSELVSTVSSIHTPDGARVEIDGPRVALYNKDGDLVFETCGRQR